MEKSKLRECQGRSTEIGKSPEASRSGMRWMLLMGIDDGIYPAIPRDGGMRDGGMREGLASLLV